MNKIQMLCFESRSASILYNSFQQCKECGGQAGHIEFLTHFDAKNEDHHTILGEQLRHALGQSKCCRRCVENCQDLERRRSQYLDVRRTLGVEIYDGSLYETLGFELRVRCYVDK